MAIKSALYFTSSSFFASKFDVSGQRSLLPRHSSPAKNERSLRLDNGTFSQYQVNNQENNNSSRAMQNSTSRPLYSKFLKHSSQGILFRNISQNCLSINSPIVNLSKLVKVNVGQQLLSKSYLL